MNVKEKAFRYLDEHADDLAEYLGQLTSTRQSSAVMATRGTWQTSSTTVS